MTLHRWLIPVLVVVGAGVTLASFAYRFAGREFEQKAGELDAALESTLDGCVTRCERAIDTASQTARGRLARALAGERVEPGGTIAYVSASGRIRFAKPEDPSVPSEESLRYFNLATRGGESFEYAREDYGRALDAYGFYLDRIEDREPRDRLRLRIARVAFKARRPGLTISIWQDLFDERSSTREGTLPIDLIAGLRLLSLQQAGANVQVDRALRHRLLERAPTLSTEALRHCTERLDPRDPELTTILALRERVESLVRTYPEQVLRGHTVVDGDQLLVASPAEDGVAVSLAAVRWPPLPSDPVHAEIVGASSEAATGSGVRERTLTSPDSGVVFARLRVTDPDHGERLATFQRSRRLQQSLVIGLLLLASGTGLALWVVMDRKRRLAELKVRLLANVSHELKTPITSIRIFAELLAEEELEGEKVRRFGKLLTAESQRLTQRIDDLLDYAQSERRERALNTETVDVGALLSPIAHTFSYRARQSGARFHFRPTVPPDGSPGLVSSPHAIERIVLNLLDNALKYRQDRDPEIELSLHFDTAGARIAVRDNGVGISREDQALIFDEFYRARFDDFGVQGSGLGLAIARSLATRVGATLSVESETGKGSTFTIALPYAGAASLEEKSHDG